MLSDYTFWTFVHAQIIWSKKGSQQKHSRNPHVQVNARLLVILYWTTCRHFSYMLFGWFQFSAVVVKTCTARTAAAFPEECVTLHYSRTYETKSSNVCCFLVWNKSGFAKVCYWIRFIDRITIAQNHCILSIDIHCHTRGLHAMLQDGFDETEDARSTDCRLLRFSNMWTDDQWREKLSVFYFECGFPRSHASSRSN